MSDSQVPEPVVRAATAADVPTLGRLGALLVQEHQNFDPRRFLGVTESTSTHYGSFLDSQLAEPNVFILVAELEGSVVGYAYAAIEDYDYMALRGPAAVLHDVIVDPAYRGRGVGQALLTETLAALTAHQAPRVVLSTAARNESAQRFFERAGFRRTMIELTRELP